MQKKVREKFILVEFTDCFNENGLADIDIVPAEWIYYDNNAKTCKTPCPNPPYDEQSCKIIHARVKNSLAPLSNWPDWSVNIKGSVSK